MSDVVGLRPTPNRVRETLFNWLQSITPGARLLDVFSGSGALGFEAASRGAAQVTMLEQQRDVVEQLQKTKQQLKAHQVNIVMTDALTWLSENRLDFDVIFFDPPFHTDLIARSLAAIRRNGLLSENTIIYIESEPQLALPDELIIDKQKQTGQVQYGLYHFNNGCFGKQ